MKVECKSIEGKINFKDVEFRILFLDGKNELKLKRINIEENVIEEYNDHLRLFCYEMVERDREEEEKVDDNR